MEIAQRSRPPKIVVFLSLGATNSLCFTTVIPSFQIFCPAQFARSPVEIGLEEYMRELHHLGSVPIVIQQMNQFPTDVSWQDLVGHDRTAAPPALNLSTLCEL